MNQPSFDNKKDLDLIKNILEGTKTLSDIVSQIENNRQLFTSIGIALPWLISFCASPQVQLGASILPLFKLFLDVSPDQETQQPSFVKCTAIIIPLAFRESAREILGVERFKNIFSDDQVIADFFSKELVPVKDDDEAKAILDDFPNSEFAKNFTKRLKSVISIYCPKENPNQIPLDLDVERIKYGTPKYIFKVLEQLKDVDILKSWFDESRQANYRKYKNIDDHIKQVQGFPKETVFEKEEICIKSLYIPLKAKNKTNSDLEQKVIDSIYNTENQDIILIEAGPGRGKTFFCKMFANRIANEIYPIFIPILIKLRNINLQQGFIETLKKYFTETFNQKIDTNFLNDFKFIFILDGFDELQIQQDSEVVKKLFDQLQYFQQNHPKHRVILTGRTLALPSELPKNLLEFELQPMDNELREKWLEKWQAIYQGSAKPFKEFLDKCPEQINDLAREPLLLTLLARMYREDPDKIQALELINNESKQAKTFIYEQFFDWVINGERGDLQEGITGLKPEGLETIITEAALCVVQGGTEYSTIEILNKRLPKDITSSQEKKLTNALTAFYFRKNSSGSKDSSKDKGGGFEFIHKSFCEFSFAKRIYEGLNKCTDEIIYDLLGYRGLTIEIVEYLRGLWENNENNGFKPLNIFNELQTFYIKWSDRQFINSIDTNLPLDKAQKLKKDQFINLGQLEVDVFTGFNVMILLFELHRYGQSKDGLKKQINFNPDYDDPTTGMPLTSFLKNINYFHSSLYIGLWVYCNDILLANLKGANLEEAHLTGAHLERANLTGANLTGANLTEAHLQGANLEGANLQGVYLFGGANLQGANLQGANLEGAKLQGAKLQGAILRGAKLIGADLEGANLRYAYLEGAKLQRANLIDANLIDANLQSIIFDAGTYWPDKKEVFKAHNIPEELKEQLGL